MLLCSGISASVNHGAGRGTRTDNMRGGSGVTIFGTIIAPLIKHCAFYGAILCRQKR